MWRRFLCIFLGVLGSAAATSCSDPVGVPWTSALLSCTSFSTLTVDSYATDLSFLSNVQVIDSLIISTATFLEGTFPKLTTLRTLTVQGNTAVRALHFPKLTTMSGGSQLTLQDCGVEVVTMPLLTNLNGNVEVVSCPIKQFSVPRLTTVGGVVFKRVLGLAFSAPLVTSASWVHFEDTLVTSVRMPKLTVMSQGFSIKNNSRLAEFYFPKLTTMSASFSLYTNPKLTVLDLPSFTAMPNGQLDFKENGLTRFSAINLESIPSWTGIGDEPNLRWIRLPKFRTTRMFVLWRVGVEHLELASLEETSIEGLTLQELPRLVSIHIPSLAFAGQVFIKDCPVLEEVRLPALVRVEQPVAAGAGLEIKDNPKLTLVSLPSFHNATKVVIRMQGSVGPKSLLMPQLQNMNPGAKIFIQAPGLTTLHLDQLRLGANGDAFQSGGALEVPDMCCSQTTALLTAVGAASNVANACGGSCKCSKGELLAVHHAAFVTGTLNLEEDSAVNIMCNNGFVVSGTARICKSGNWTGTQTCTCPAGKYVIDDRCQPCPPGCASCEACNATSVDCGVGVRCTSCSAGNTRDPTVRGGVCCQGSNTCAAMNRQSCVANTGPMGSSCGECFEGYYFDGGVCVACPPGCRRCSGGGYCVECHQHYTMNGDRCCVGNALCTASGRGVCAVPGDFCAENCTSGWYNDRGTCRRCPNSCAQCLGPNQCTVCYNGQTPQEGFCCNDNCPARNMTRCLDQGAPCKECKPGYYSTNNFYPPNCQPCPELGCAACLHDGRCTQCKAGFASHNGRCCNSAGKASCFELNRSPCTVGGGTCGTCLPGTHEDGGICVCDVACENGGQCRFSAATQRLECECPSGFVGSRCQRSLSHLATAEVNMQGHPSLVFSAADPASGVVMGPARGGALMMTGNLQVHDTVEVHGSVVAGGQPIGQLLGTVDYFSSTIVASLQEEQVPSG